MTVPLARGTGSDRLLSTRRALLSLVGGLLAGAVVAVVASPRLLPLTAWTVTVAVLLSWVWSKSWTQDSAGTKHLAEQEQTSRSTDVWLVASAVASLAIVVVALVQSSSQRSPTAVASVILSVVSVALAWALINTVFAFKYARLYYLDEPDDGGIDFGPPGGAQLVRVPPVAFP